MSRKDVDDFGENQQSADSDECSQNDAAEIDRRLSVAGSDAAVRSVAASQRVSIAGRQAEVSKTLSAI